MNMETLKAHQPKLVLFDIDGTLLITKGASSRCMKLAGKLIFGPTFTWSPVTVGTLDPQIFDQLAVANDIHPTEQQRQEYQAAYLNYLDKELHNHQDDITLMPGIEPLVEQLHRRATVQRDLAIGVLTGNFRHAAHLKLTLSGLGLERFPIIVCAEDGRTRDELPRVAMRQAQPILGCPIVPSHTILIGDTPRDIQCGKANDCSCISVATGHYSKEDLLKAGGEVVFDTLADTDRVISTILGRATQN